MTTENSTNSGPYVIRTGLGFLKGDAIDMPHHKAQVFETITEAETVARATLGKRTRSAGNIPVTRCTVFQVGRYTPAGIVAVIS